MAAVKATRKRRERITICPHTVSAGLLAMRAFSLSAITLIGSLSLPDHSWYFNSFGKRNAVDLHLMALSPLGPGVQWQQRRVSSAKLYMSTEIAWGFNLQFTPCQYYSNYEVLTGANILSRVKLGLTVDVNFFLNKDVWNTPVAS